MPAASGLRFASKHATCDPVSCTTLQRKQKAKEPLVALQKALDLEAWNTAQHDIASWALGNSPFPPSTTLHPSPPSWVLSSQKARLQVDNSRIAKAPDCPGDREHSRGTEPQAPEAAASQTSSGACGLEAYTTRARCKVCLASLLDDQPGVKQHAILCLRRQRAIISNASASTPAGTMD